MSDPATASTSTDEAVLPIPDLQRTSAVAVAVGRLLAARVVVLELRGKRTLPAAVHTVAQEHFVLSQSKLQHLHADAKKKLREGVERDGGSSCSWTGDEDDRGLIDDDAARWSRLASAGTTEMGAWLSLDPSVAQQLDGGDKLAQSLKEKNEAELKLLEDKITDAEQNQGETELSDALRAKASYLAKIGEKVRGLPLP